jgi:hypothetical protein
MGGESLGVAAKMESFDAAYSHTNIFAKLLRYFDVDRGGQTLQCD